MLLARAVVVWLLVIAVEIAHGAFRNKFLAPAVGDFRARQISVFTGSVLIFLVTLLTIRWIAAASKQQLLAIGFLWVVLTIAFEVGLGRGVGISWHRILSDYDLVHGGLLPLGLLAMLFSPWAAARVRKLLAARRRRYTENSPP